MTRGTQMSAREPARRWSATILIAGGGTGGHVFPMIAVGDAARSIDAETRVVYVGTSRGIESRVMGARGDDLRLLDVAPLRGNGALGFARGVSRAAAAIPEARSLVRALRPDVVLSLGGYAAGPVSLAARTLGVPVTLLEPNAVLGLSNKFLSPFIERAYVAFPEAEKFLRPSVVRRFGVPLRRAFAAASYEGRAAKPALDVLVLGGSQGAKSLNENVPRAFALAKERGAAYRVIHQTGKDRDAGVRERYAALGVDANVVPFIDDVASVIAEADVVIARSGASSCAELCAVGRPSILVPFPFAADDHQRKNAESLERAGAAVCLLNEEATPPTIAAELQRLARDPNLRSKMAAAASALGKPDAARDIARDLLDLAAARARRASNTPIERSA